MGRRRRRKFQGRRRRRRRSRCGKRDPEGVHAVSLSLYVCPSHCIFV
jgi:hypothetical protein